MDFNSNEKNIINENYYEILNEAKSFLINDNPISESISKSFEIHGLSNSDENIFDLNKNNNEDKNDKNRKIGNFFENNKNHEINDNYLLLKEKLIKTRNINKSQEKQIKNQEKLIEKLKNNNDFLSKELNEKNQKIASIEKDLKESKLKESKAILRDKKVASKIKLLKTIQKKYKEEKELRISLKEKLNKRLAFDDFTELSMFTPIKIIKSFTKNGLNEANNIYKLKRDDIVYLSSSKGEVLKQLNFQLI
ncbi:hypothetical protein ALNOE001_00760 [Candidatus Methanobinarius endosymbioticus]|uniref:Chromosome partition protein Smc n=1 Tax=Candidatus Methanobinarius endosymbioticus TaxID=2006182 RepID=A0A366MFR7_9EURY|nr:hypothetical protein ALNOE001_00760 [Candidatus Methanobinarius endosymbioticus]